ncbi:hypothetical protein TRICI_002258 [Trichomonascus ciferrii]|uniref:Uncharacterized protein n=1 Tax=Trichomonascus ciferrii TaxID=44093 RepID=A0A642V7J7_9ASCO|nr:hypothetical protein TRICI_002258 [Trichomonascus ciferrii]
MPPHPDSPNLNATPGSPMRGSPIKSSFHSRNLSSLSDDRISELLELAKELKTQTKSVEDSVNDALVEFGGLAHRSRDNAYALGHLKEHVVTTERSVKDTDATVKDNLAQIRATLDTLQENNKVVSTISDSLLESNKDVSRQLKNHESHLRSILSTSAEHREFPKMIKKFSDLFDEQNGKVMEVLNFIHEDISNVELKTRINDSFKVIESLSQQFSQQQTDLSAIAERLSSTNSSDEQLALLKDLCTKLDSSNAGLTRSDVSEVVNENNSQQLIPMLTQISQNLATADKDEATTEKVNTILTKVDELLKQSTIPSDSQQQILAKLEQLGNSIDGHKELQSNLESLMQKHASKEDIQALLDEEKSLKAIVEGFSQKLDSYSAERNAAIKNDDNPTVTKRIDELQREQAESIQTFSNQVLEKVHDKAELASILESLKTHITGSLQSHKDTIESLRQPDNSDRLKALETQLEQQSTSQLEALKTLFIEQQTGPKLDDFMNSIQQKLTDTQTETSKTITDIQSDVRSLVDFQYGDISSFGEQVQAILTRLDEIKHQEGTEARIAEAEARASMFEQRAKEAEEKLLASTGDAKEIEQINKKLETKSQLESEISTLQQTKATLAQEVQAMKTELSIRYEDFNKIEQRVEHFEQRLNQAILERSKGILGSTTMTIINNNNALPPNSAGSTTTTSPERAPLKTNSNSKRNLSFAPEADSLEGLPIGKENDLTVAKRGSPYSKPSHNKGRSISLFVDH